MLQIYKDYVNHMDGELIDSSLKVTAFENVQVVSNGGLPVNLAVPGSIFSTDVSLYSSKNVSFKIKITID